MAREAQVDPSREALSIFNEAIQELTSPLHNLISILRKCQHACEILGWEDQRKWFHNELNGYQLGLSPSYRFISGKKIWKNLSSGISNSTLSEEIVYGRDESIYDEEPDTIEVYAEVAWIIQAANSVYSENTDETKKVPSPSRKKQITLTRVRVFQKQSFGRLLKIIENKVFDFVSSAYTQLRYSQQITDIWNFYRQKVDSELSKYDFQDHLDTINKNIQSTNPEDWRVAVLECRNLLNDIATFLWKDPRKTYNLLPGQGDEGNLAVTQDKFGNRIAAYLHQKGISGTRGKFLRNEAERIAESILAIIPYQSKAHASIERIDAQSIVINTYILIGELLIRTDFEPVTEYQEN